LEIIRFILTSGGSGKIFIFADSEIINNSNVLIEGNILAGSSKIGPISIRDILYSPKCVLMGSKQCSWNV